MKALYNTPTDAVSQKKFDRSNDQHIRRYVRLSEEVKAIRLQLKALVAGEEE